MMSSIRDIDACHKAATLATEGIPTGTYIRGVCGLWADGQNSKGLDAIYRIKGAERSARPVGTTLMSSAFVELLDVGKIHRSIRGLFLDNRELVNRLGSICFLRVPIKKEVGESLPARLVSRADDGMYWIQNWLPEGCRATQAWMEALRNMNIVLPVATSLNVSGEPEIVDQEEGRKFCEENQVPIFLVDRKSPGRAKGSFPILRVNSDDLTLLREGHFPAALFQSLLDGWGVDLSSYQPAKFPPVDIPIAITRGMASPEQLRLNLLEYLDG